MIHYVVAVRAALPSPRPQGWQALQSAVGFAEAGLGPVALVGDAGLPDGGPVSLSDWLGRDLPPDLRVIVPPRPARPPLAGLRFRAALRALRSGSSRLVCRDPRVAAQELGGGWRALLLEWHVAPDPSVRAHAAALRAPRVLHASVASGLCEALRRAGVPESRLRLIPNACGLDRARVLARPAPRPDAPVIAVSLQRREGLDLALRAWARHLDLPPLLIAGRDQGGVRAAILEQAVSSEPSLQGRVHLLGPRWGAEREDLIDTAGAWLAPYPQDETTERDLCPLQVVDAAGSGRNLIAPELPSVRAAAGPGLFTYAPGSADALACAVRQALVSPRPLDAADRPRWQDRARLLHRFFAEAEG